MSLNIGMFLRSVKILLFSERIFLLSEIFFEVCNFCFRDCAQCDHEGDLRAPVGPGQVQRRPSGIFK